MKESHNIDQWTVSLAPTASGKLNIDVSHRSGSLISDIEDSIGNQDEWGLRLTSQAIETDYKDHLDAVNKNVTHEAQEPSYLDAFFDGSINGINYSLHSDVDGHLSIYVGGFTGETVFCETDYIEMNKVFTITLEAT
jgi:hypothetical protein